MQKSAEIYCWSTVVVFNYILVYTTGHMDAGMDGILTVWNEKWSVQHAIVHNIVQYIGIIIRIRIAETESKNRWETENLSYCHWNGDMGGFLWFYERVEWLVREIIICKNIHFYYTAGMTCLLFAKDPVTDPFLGLEII